MKLRLSIFLVFSIIQLSTGQSFKGELKEQAGQQIGLIGFDYYKSFNLSTTTIDSLGYFELHFPETYQGMGVLKTADDNSIIVALTEDDITLKGSSLQDTDGLLFINSPQNEKFANFAKRNVKERQAYQAWIYLQPLYQNTNSKESKALSKVISKELNRIEHSDSIAIQKLSNHNYLYWFLKNQMFVNNMSPTLRDNKWRLDESVNYFRSIDFNNPNFKTSGLFRELIEAHYSLLEKTGQNLDSAYVQMNKSTDYLVEGLINNDNLLNGVSNELFNYFEKRSLFTAADYLSNKVLKIDGFKIDESLANKMEKYRSLKVGMQAPDIIFNDTSKLSDLKKPVLLVFGASSCPQCKVEANELLVYSENWKTTNKNVEVVYISLDTDEETFQNAYHNAPWKTYCDFKGWDTQAAKDYFVNGTPSYIIVDSDLKILFNPNGLNHANAWINAML